MKFEKNKAIMEKARSIINDPDRVERLSERDIGIISAAIGLARITLDTLAAVTAERDAAIEDIERHIRNDETNCTMCAYKEGCKRNYHECGRDAKWRGKGESNGI